MFYYSLLIGLKKKLVFFCVCRFQKHIDILIFIKIPIAKAFRKFINEAVYVFYPLIWISFPSGGCSYVRPGQKKKWDKK